MADECFDYRREFHLAGGALLWLPGNPLHDERPKAAKALWTFRCLLCGNQAASEQNLPPMCTGPGWMDEHPPEVMEPYERGRSAPLAAG